MRTILLVSFLVLVAVVSAEEKKNQYIASKEELSNYLKFFEGFLGKKELEFECPDRYLKPGKLENMLESLRIIAGKPETIQLQENREKIADAWSTTFRVLERCGRKWFVSFTERMRWYRAMSFIFKNWETRKESEIIKKDQAKLKEIAALSPEVAPLLETLDYEAIGRWVEKAVALLESEDMKKIKENADSVEFAEFKKKQREDKRNSRKKIIRKSEKKPEL